MCIRLYCNKRYVNLHFNLDLHIQDTIYLPSWQCTYFHQLEFEPTRLHHTLYSSDIVYHQIMVYKKKNIIMPRDPLTEHDYVYKRAFTYCMLTWLHCVHHWGVEKVARVITHKIVPRIQFHHKNNNQCFSMQYPWILISLLYFNEIFHLFVL